MLKIPTKYLLLVNGLLWTVIGIKIALIGVDYYGRLDCYCCLHCWSLADSSLCRRKYPHDCRLKLQAWGGDQSHLTGLLGEHKPDGTRTFSLDF